MLRLKYTTAEGKVFQGPFVYDLNERQAKQKLRKLDWIVERNDLGEPIGEANLEFVEEDEYPKEAVYDEALAGLHNVRTIEKKWRKLNADNREDIEEVEEGSS